ARFGSVAELADTLQRPIDPPRNLPHKRMTTTEDLNGKVDDLVGVRRVRYVVRRKDERLREAPVLLLVFGRVFPKLFEDLSIRVGGRDALLDVRWIEVPLILQLVELLKACLGVDDAHAFPFFEEHALHPDVGLDRDDVVVDEISLAHRPRVLVPIDDVTEV